MPTTRIAAAAFVAATALSLAGVATPAAAATEPGTPRGNAYYDDNAGLPGGGGVQAKTSGNGQAFVSIIVFVDDCLTDAPMLNISNKVYIGSNGFFSASQTGTMGTVTIEGAFISTDQAVGTVKVDPTEIGGSTPGCSYRGAFQLFYDAS